MTQSHGKPLCEGLAPTASLSLLIRSCEVSIPFRLCRAIDAKWRKASAPLANSARQAGLGGYVRVTRSANRSFALLAHRALLLLLPPVAAQAYLPGLVVVLGSALAITGAGATTPNFPNSEVLSRILQFFSAVPFALKRFWVFVFANPTKPQNCY